VAELEAIGITTANQAASLRFYGLVGVEVPDPGEDHVEAPVLGGLHLMWDTEELIRQIEPDLPTPVRQRIVLAFRCADPSLRVPPRPRREHGRSLRAPRLGTKARRREDRPPHGQRARERRDEFAEKHAATL